MTSPSPMSFTDISYAERTTDYALTNVATEFISLPPIAFDGVTAHQLEFFSPAATIEAGTLAIVAILLDNADAGHLVSASNGAGNQAIGCVLYAKRRLIPPSGVHTFSAAAIKNGPGAVTLRAGLGSPGALIPMFLHIVRTP